MSAFTSARPLEERRQALILDAQDQIKRLQAMDLTKRTLAEAATQICERDMAIRQLMEGWR